MRYEIALKTTITNTSIHVIIYKWYYNVIVPTVFFFSPEHYNIISDNSEALLCFIFPVSLKRYAGRCYRTTQKVYHNAREHANMIL